MKTVRELSVPGPCITLGLVLRETDRRISYRDRHGTPKFISRRWAIHTEACPSCLDLLVLPPSDIRWLRCDPRSSRVRVNDRQKPFSTLPKQRLW
jgi:hypothetical protein